jgi:S-adenosylmethionine-diacylgycerolhomoserine-N-methlytransferase
MQAETTQDTLACGQSVKMERYYRLHSHIYDYTRWSFLFGRKKIVGMTADFVKPRRILEVGCGTGANLSALAKTFPNAMITGVDVSDSMLSKSRRLLQKYGNRIELLNYNYNRPVRRGSYDLVLFSYTLTMLNPGWQEALNAATDDLAPRGCLAVVDFHRSGPAWFSAWMGLNHVRMEGELLPLLQQQFNPQFQAKPKAYGGLWQYFCFIGNKRH